MWFPEREIISARTGPKCTPGLRGRIFSLRRAELKEGFHLEVLVDKNLIEVYANDGEYVVSSVVYGITDEIGLQP